MSRHHASMRSLSSYLDDELNDNEKSEVQLHLLDCAECRDRVKGLQRVVERLEQVEQRAVPGYLSGQVHSRIRWSGNKRRWWDTLERGLGGGFHFPTVIPVAAVVMALATIGVMFVAGLQRSQPRIPVILTPPETSPESAGGPNTEMGPPRRLEAMGRQFVLHDGTWFEEGPDLGEPERTLRLDSQEALDLLRDHPDLQGVDQLGAPVRLKLGTTVLEILPGPETGSP